MSINSLFAYLEDVYSPVTDIRTDTDLKVIGTIPKDLCGVYAQNNPNPQFPPEGLHHWFDGDGMIHGVQLREGKATYRNRYVRTEAFEQESVAGGVLWNGILNPIDQNSALGPDKDTANTDLISFNGRLLATWWLSGQPYAIDPITLETIGMDTFDDSLKVSFAAHPKVDPRTGELVFFGYNPYQQPYLHGGVISKEGKVTSTASLECSNPSLFHDVAISENHTIFLDLPMNWDLEKLQEGKRRVRFHRDKPSRFGVMPRHDDGGNCQWFELPACYIYHTINAYEEEDDKGNTVVVMTACRIENPVPEIDHDQEPMIPRLFFLRLHPFLYEFRFNLGTGEASQRQLDDCPTEFPRTNDALLGVKQRWSYNPRIAKEPTLLFDGFIKYDLYTGEGRHVSYGRGRIGGETVFVPSPNPQSEDDGYVMTFLRDRLVGSSELVIYSAREPSQEPLARVLIPRPVPFGFHAEWAPHH